MAHSGRHTHLGFGWNLFLAWIPLAAAVLAYNVRRRAILAIAAAAWILFFPNAPYLVTDLIHLRPLPGAPHWYDAIMLAAFAWNGLFLGLASLLLMHRVVCRHASALTGWLFVVAAVLAGSFGIYLGRFERFNSWDALTDPTVVLVSAASRLSHPMIHLRTIVFSLIFSALLLTTYLMLIAFTRMQAARD